MMILRYAPSAQRSSSLGRESAGGRSPRARSAQILCGVVAGPLFVTAFTVIGATRHGYDWRRYPVSSLAIGRQGWRQRTNFILAGVLFFCAAAGLGRCDRRRIGPRAVPALIAGVGIGLIGGDCSSLITVVTFWVILTRTTGGRPLPPQPGQLLRANAQPLRDPGLCGHTHRRLGQRDHRRAE
jgi:uncharacterized protein DUF998